MILKCLKDFYMESLKQQLQNFVRENSKQLEISIRLVHAKSETDYHWNLHLALSQQAHL